MTGRLVAVGVLAFGIGWIVGVRRAFRAGFNLGMTVGDPDWLRGRYEGQLRALEQKLAHQREVNEELHAAVGEVFEAGRWVEREAMS